MVHVFDISAHNLFGIDGAGLTLPLTKNLVVMMERVVLDVFPTHWIVDIFRKPNHFAPSAIVRKLYLLAKGLDVIPRFSNRGAAEPTNQHASARHGARFAMGFPIRLLAH